MSAIRSLVASSTAMILVATIGVGGLVSAAERTAPSPLSGLETEEVEPGVVRILHDGVRDLSGADAELPTTYGEYGRTHMGRAIVAGLDGSVRILQRDGHFALGEQDVEEWGQPRRHYVRSDSVRVTANGTIWRVPRGHRMRSIRNGRQSVRRDGEFHLNLDLSPGGRVWATAFDVCTDAEGCHPARVLRSTKDGWRVVEAPRLNMRSGGAFVASASNEAWLCCRRNPAKGDPGLLRLDGRRWVVEDSPYDGPSDDRLLMDSAVRNTLWVRRTPSVLEHYDDGRWTVFDEDDGLPPVGYIDSGEHFKAEPGGGVWFTVSASTGSPDDEFTCDGVAHFDGEIVTRFLGGLCVYAMDVAPDGTLWLQAATAEIENVFVTRLLSAGPLQTYAITAFSPSADE